MSKEMKQKRILLAAVLGGSVLLIAALTVLQVEAGKRIEAVVLWVLAAMTVYGAARMRTGQKSVARIQEANRLFTEQHDTDGYIAALQELIRTEEGSQAQQILHINLTVAYCDKRNYEKALAALQRIPRPEKLNASNAAFYWVNLALCNFYLDRYEEGMAIVNEQRKTFERLRAAGQMGCGPVFLEIFELLAQGQREDAAALLENARTDWENEKTAADFAFIAGKCGVELRPLAQPEAEENGEEA